MVQDIYSSRTYVWIRRMVLVSLYGVSDLSNILFDLLRWSMVSRDDAVDDIDSDDGAHDLIMR